MSDTVSGDESEEEESEEEESEPEPTPVTKTPRVYEVEVSEPKLHEQPKKSALKKTPNAVNNRTLQTNKASVDNVQTNFNSPGARSTPPPDRANNAMSSPKATPVNQGPPRPKPRITLLRLVTCLL